MDLHPCPGFTSTPTLAPKGNALHQGQQQGTRFRWVAVSVAGKVKGTRKTHLKPSQPPPPSSLGGTCCCSSLSPFTASSKEPPAQPRRTSGSPRQEQCRAQPATRFPTRTAAAISTAATAQLHTPGSTSHAPPALLAYQHAGVGWVAAQ